MKKIFLFILLFVCGITIGILTPQFIPKDYPLLSPLGLVEHTDQKPLKIVGFMPFWLINKLASSYDNQINEFSYFDLIIDKDGSIRKLANPQEEEPGWTTLKSNSQLSTRLKTANENKIGLSLVVFSGETETIKQLIVNPEESAANLVSDVTSIMQQYGFTDLNLDIENIENTTQDKRDLFTRFVKAVKSGMVKNNLGTLTVDIQGISLFQPYLTDPQKMGEIADFVLLMTYDYHYPGSLLAGPVAPLGGAGEERVFDVNLTLKAALAQIPKEKIILGIPLYGYEWNTVDNFPGAPAIPGTGVIASNNRVSELLKSCLNCTKQTDKVSLEPFLIFPEETHYHQIFYEDNAAIKSKLELASKSKISGVAFWALGYEATNDLSGFSNYLLSN